MNKDEARESVDRLMETLSFIRDQLNSEPEPQVIPEYNADIICENDLNTVFTSNTIPIVWKIVPKYVRCAPCGKCRNGLIKVQDSFYNHYEVCKCVRYVATYYPEKMYVRYVVATEGDDILVCDNDTQIYRKFVCDCQDQLDSILGNGDAERYFYKTEELCLKACEVLNDK